MDGWLDDGGRKKMSISCVYIIIIIYENMNCIMYNQQQKEFYIKSANHVREGCAFSIHQSET